MMTPQRQRSRENIRSEMIREVARLWNYDETDMAVERFDPLVGLLLGAFATGIEGLHHELQNSRSRIIQRLAQLLTPGTLTGAQPAHAVMRTRVVDPQFTVQPTHVFSCNTGGREVHFSPAGTFQLSNVALKTSIIQNKVRDYGAGAKEAFLNQVLPGDACWLGLTVDEDTTALTDMTLFFDWRNDPLRLAHADKMVDARVFMADTELTCQPGLPDMPLADTNSLAGQMHEHTQRFYGSHFLTISSIAQKTGQPISLINGQGCFPAELDGAFTPEELAKHFVQNLLWLKIVFPASLPAETTYRTHIEVNAFPVLNRRLCVDTHELRPLFNVFPVRVEAQEAFLEIASVETPGGGSISQAQQLGRDSQYQYVLRQGGITRFDERDGYDMLTYLTTLLRDESAMFMTLGRSELETEIEEIRKRLEKINAAIGTGGEQRSFVTVKTPEKAGRLTIKFWSTYAEQANRIPFGTKLSKDRSQLAFVDDESVLLTTTTGGRNALTPDDTLPAFRQALLTRGRIVTVADIRAVCFAELGDKLSAVAVTKGVTPGVSKSQGLVRTIDVVLTPNPAKATPPDQWDEYCHRLKHIIDQQSFTILPYRVLVSKQASPVAGVRLNERGYDTGR
ncbi:type VI secretion system baseplate subunit TssF [Fibrella aquatilis]|uniref:Type VI secretion system baseplate subunit TssF n=1 Tax=Fibrella aquatilis TaxID=2817059 RepID=A0A939K1N7_9BACT|nr:type VI secretion system baseplate subunit TssF [Fibrella aquatilis]MBO0932455.1 type VI secretion system baseplate subunit TssF [Fibrella aquatilis]